MFKRLLNGIKHYKRVFKCFEVIKIEPKRREE